MLCTSFSRGLSLQHRALVCFSSVVVGCSWSWSWAGLRWGVEPSCVLCRRCQRGLDDRLEPQPLTDPRLCRPGAQDKAPFQHSLSFPLNFPLRFGPVISRSLEKMGFIIIMISITTFIMHWVMGKDEVFEAHLLDQYNSFTEYTLCHYLYYLPLCHFIHIVFFFLQNTKKVNAFLYKANLQWPHLSSFNITNTHTHSLP